MSALVVLPISDLETLIRKAVSDALQAQRPASEPSAWLTPDDVARLLGYKRRSIPGLVRHRRLPCHRVGRLLRFRRDEVERWVRDQDGGGA